MVKASQSDSPGGNMKDLPLTRPASFDRARDTTWCGLSRREFLARVSALGGMALASTASAQRAITTTTPYDKLPPYGNNTLPGGVRPRLVPNVNGLTVNMLEAGTQSEHQLGPELDHPRGHALHAAADGTEGCRADITVERGRIRIEMIR